MREFFVSLHKDVEERGWKTYEMYTSLIRNGVFMKSRKEYCATQIWTITRGCILRIVWLEKNLRIFNRNNSRRYWFTVEHQVTLDTQDPIESARRKLQTSKT